MMISSNFNRFIFGVVLPELRQAPILIFNDFNFRFRPSQLSKESIRELLKHLDINFPREDNDLPSSYTKLSTEQMRGHIEWIVKTAGESGYELPHITEEWDRLLYKAGISK